MPSRPTSLMLCYIHVPVHMHVDVMYFNSLLNKNGIL